MGIIISIIIIGLIIFFTLRYIYWYDHSDTEEFIMLDLFGEWNNSEINKTITLSSSKSLHSNGYVCLFGMSTGHFIDPFSGSCQIDSFNKFLTLKGVYINTKTRVDEIMLYKMMNMNKPNNIKIDEKNYILNNKMIELKFKYIFKDINTLELIPLNENSKLFTFNQETTVWKRKEKSK